MNAVTSRFLETPKATNATPSPIQAQRGSDTVGIGRSRNAETTQSTNATPMKGISTTHNALWSRARPNWPRASAAVARVVPQNGQSTPNTNLDGHKGALVSLGFYQVTARVAAAVSPPTASGASRRHLAAAAAAPGSAP